MKSRHLGRLSLYFCAGCVMDLLVASYYRMISLRLRPQASASAIVITLTTFAIFNYVIKRWNWAAVIAYSLGTGAGTWLAMSIGLGQ
jgi:hypothetical protein